MKLRSLFAILLTVLLLLGLMAAVAAADELATAVEPEGAQLASEPAGAGIDAVSTQYAFSSSSGTYTPIVTGTVHGTASNDDTSFPAINIGFTFRYNNADYTQVSIQSNGWIAMGPTIASSYYPLSTGTYNNVIAALGRDLQGNGTTSTLWSATEGTAPNRVFIVQWTDYKRYGSSYVGDAFDFQIRLYETSNTVEVVYGPFTVLYVAAPPYGPQVGLRGNSNADFNNRALDATQSWVTSVAGTANTDAMLLTDLIYPTDGLTYDWSLATGVFLDPVSQSGSACPGSDVLYEFEVANQTGVAQAFNLSYATVWPASGPAATGVLANLGTETISPTVHIPWAANAGDVDTLTVNAADATNTYTAQATATTAAALTAGYTDYANVPVGREVRAPGVVYYDGKIYKIGGYGYVGGTGAARAWLDIYDIATDTWTAGADMPGARYWIDCEEIGGKIYCGGGYLSSGQTTLYIYDIATNTWTTGAALPAARYNAASVKLGGKYYLIGGYTTTYQATMIVYDPATDTWDSTLASMNTARRYFHAGVIGGKIYVAGGYGSSPVTYLNSAEVYDPVANTWSYVASMPSAWVNAADGVKHDRFLILTGGSPSSTSGASNGALMYDALTDTWFWMPLLDRLLYSAEGDGDGTFFWTVSGRMYDGTTWSNSPYTTLLDQCEECVPVSGADFTVDPPTPRPNMPATFTGSVAAGSPAITYDWSFGDGTYGSGQVVDHTYTAIATYTVVMTATNCDGVSLSTVTKQVVVMAGSLAVISPLSLEATQCPDSQTEQDIVICNEGDSALTWTLTETVGFLNGSRAGVESLSGSFVAFDPSAGGNTQFQPGVPGTFCFRAESFTTDWEYRYMVWLKFPADWTISNAYLVGTPVCDSGATWSGFIYGWENVPYELAIDHRAYNQSTDHCVATYCVDAIPGAGWGDAPVSWYWSGDGYANAPHHPCSDDVYTPASMAAAPCDQAINPQASIPWLDTSPVQWLNEAPTSGSVAAGECETVTVMFDSDGMAPGFYSATLTIDTNDITNPSFAIPVSLTVAGPPTGVDFTYSPASPWMNEDVAFNGTATALMPVDYSWSFGDGAYGAGQNPTHAYAAAGTYTVIMTATQCGFSVITTDTVTVLQCWSLLTEDFEGAFPPAGWSVINNGGTCVWTRNDAFATARPNYAGGDGYCADADSDKCGSGSTMDTELRTMVLDLSTATTATLQYVTAYNDIATGGDLADVDASIDGGTTWTNLLSWDADHSPNGPGEAVTIDLTQFQGQPSVILRFHYWIATYDWWWEVDQVRVGACYLPGVEPEIAVDPLSLTQTLEVNQTAMQTFNIANLGLAVLNWTLDEGCGTPVGWLSESPTGGTLNAYNDVDVEVTFDSTGLALGTYNTTVCVNSNDTDEPSIPVAVTLIVTGTPEIAVTPSSLATTLCQGETDTQYLEVCNEGTGPLVWTLSEHPVGLAAAPVAPTLPVPASPAKEQPVITSPEQCAQYANYAGKEPIGAAEFCGSPALPAMPSAGMLAPTDSGYAKDLRTPDNFVTFALNDFTGQTVLGTSTADCYGMDFDPSGTTLYGLNDATDMLGTFDLTTGAFTPLVSCPPGGGAANWTGLSIDPVSGVFYGSTATDLYIIDPTTGSSTLVGPFGTTLMIDVAMNPDGDMYGHDIGTDSIYQINPATGAATLIGLTGYAANYAQGLDFDNDDGTLYIFLYIGSGSNVYGTVNLTTGAVTPLAVSAPLGEFEGATRTVAILDVPWVTEVPTNGVLMPGECVSVAVTFDSDSLPDGVYNAELVIESNDADEPEITVPVEMTVGCADIVVTPPSLEVTLCPDATTTLTFTVCNDGFVPLDWELVEEPAAVKLNGSTTAPAAAEPRPIELKLDAAGGTSVETNPPVVDAPVTLILDDGSRDNDIGLGGTIEMLWVNRFTPAPTDFPFNLNQIQIYFSSIGLVNVGDDIVLIVYENTTGNADPAVGANFLGAFPTTVQALDTWNVYDLATPIFLGGPGDVIVGAIGMETPGTSYWPASIDQTATQARSWAGWWNASPPPTPPILPPDNWTLIDAYFPGNWMVRGYGETAEAGIPWLSEDPTEGTVPPGECTVVEVTFDSTGLAGGVYNGNLVITSNDPDTPEVTIPVTMTVLEPAAIVDVTYTVDGVEVAFDSTAIGATPLTYAWNFGDGTPPSAVPDPTHVYAATGCYTPTLTVTNGCGSDTWSEQICVCEAVAGVNFTWVPAVPWVGEMIDFTGLIAAGSPPLVWRWNFDDGTTASGKSVLHAFATPGDHVVSLKVTNGCGEEIIEHTVTVLQPYYYYYLPILTKSYMP